METLKIQEETKITTVKFIEYDGIRFYSDKTGYWQSAWSRNKKSKRLHVYIWEKYNGKVPDGYQVHHIDGDKLNNDISNLKLMSQSEHMSFHNNTDDKKKMFRKNLERNARPKAIEWHKSDAGRELGKIHYENTLRKLVGVTEKKNCVFCGKEFDAPIMRPGTKFCSEKCKSSARRKNRVDDIEKTCVICGNIFMGNKHNGVKTCSLECKHALINQVRFEKYGKSKKRVPTRD